MGFTIDQVLYTVSGVAGTFFGPSAIPKPF
jgi:hypothetical protein